MSEQLIQTPCAFGDNGNFLLERELGLGGMGGVYMGRDKMLDRQVAVKVMQKEFGSDPEFVEKFKKEAQSSARLIHPNIAQVYSYGICEGMPYIAMELASGGSLYSIMNANPGKTDVTRVLKICQQVALALQCATDQGCVHGDVKPENILLDASGNAKLVDFGLAAMQKQTDEIWGTPYYISPEKVKKEPIDFRADIYSLGGTLYHALTGVAPFEGEDSIAVVKKRFEGMPKKPSEIRADISPAIDELVMKMLALNKEDRYPSFEALLAAFKSVLENGLMTDKVPTSATTAGTKRMTVRGRRTVAMRRPGMSGIKRKLDEDENEDSKKPAEEEDDEEENSGNLGLKVVGVVVGAIALIGLVIGGLIWYQVSSKNASIAEEQAQIVTGCKKATSAIEDTVSSARKFADEFDAFALRAIVACQKPTDDLKKLLPEDQGAMLKPESSKELMEAIALTNEAKVVEAPTVAAPATTNVAPAKVDTSTNAAPAKTGATTNATPAKAEASSEKKDEPKAEIPQVVLNMNELWTQAYGCQACAVRIRHATRKLMAKASEANGFTGEPTRQNMEKLAELSRVLVDMFEQIKTSKDVETVRTGIPLIKSKGERIYDQTVKRLKKERLERERKEKAEAAEAQEKDRKEKAEAEKKAKIDEECTAIAEKFETIAAQGSFRQLDWKSALRQLESAKEEFKTAEGQLAADLQIRKVNDMKKVQDIFIKNMNGHTFKGKLKGATVTSASEKGITMTKGKNKTTLSWQKFYKDYAGNMNELINIYIVGARKPTAKNKLNLSEWADAMTGAALTLKLVCAEVNGAVEKADQLVQDIVKDFPEYKKTAQEIFPDAKFENTEE